MGFKPKPRPRKLVHCVARQPPLRLVIKDASRPDRRPEEKGKRPGRVLTVTASVTGLMVAGLAFGLFASLSETSAEAAYQPVSRQSCQAPTESHGTGVLWDRNPVTAFQRASKEDKLVFLLHLSGNFDTPEET